MLGEIGGPSEAWIALQWMPWALAMPVPVPVPQTSAGKLKPQAPSILDFAEW